MREKMGQLLSRFLVELGVKVIPLTEAAADGREVASSRARQVMDCLITPTVKRAAREKEDFYARLAAMSQRLSARWEKLPKVSFPVVDDQGPVFESFAKIGLLFTKNLEKIRQAYKKAGAAEGLWETA